MLRATLTLLFLTQACLGAQEFFNPEAIEGFSNPKERGLKRYLNRNKFSNKRKQTTLLPAATFPDALENIPIATEIADVKNIQALPIKALQIWETCKFVRNGYIKEKSLPDYVEQTVLFNLESIPNKNRKDFFLRLDLTNGDEVIKRFRKIGPRSAKKSSWTKKIKCFLDPQKRCCAELSILLRDRHKDNKTATEDKLPFNSSGNSKDGFVFFKTWPLEKSIRVELQWNESKGSAIPLFANKKGGKKVKR